MLVSVDTRQNCLVITRAHHLDTCRNSEVPGVGRHRVQTKGMRVLIERRGCWRVQEVQTGGSLNCRSDLRQGLDNKYKLMRIIFRIILELLALSIPDIHYSG